MHKHGTTTLAGYAWAFDAAGRITSFTSPDGGGSFDYDANGQLANADYSAQADEGYSYDSSGNRTNAGYQTDDDNRLTSDGTHGYQYDAEGNLTLRTTTATGETVEYAWDYRNRLTGLTFRDGQEEITKEVRYTYDVFDRRIGKAVDADANGTFELIERYVYDGDNIVLVLKGNGDVTHRYLQGPGIDRTLAEEVVGHGHNSDVKWLLGDHQGSVRDVIDEDGAIINHVIFGSFGSVVSQTAPANATRYGFCGRELDSESGLYYNRLRYYDASTGRFISQDPISFAAGDANLYRYVLNSPANFTDPMGTELSDTQWRGVGKAAVGTGEIVIGVVTVFVHPVLGGALIIHGVSTYASGLKQIDLDRETSSPIAFGIRHLLEELGVPPQAAYELGNILDALIGMGLTLGSAAPLLGQLSSAMKGLSLAMRGGLAAAMAGGGTTGLSVSAAASAAASALAAAGMQVGGPMVLQWMMRGQGSGPGKPGSSGTSSSGGTSSSSVEGHHQLPNQYADKFKKVGLDIEDFKVNLGRAPHRLKPDGLHTGTGAENWNGAWRQFFAEKPDASKTEILDQLSKMRKDFGLE